MPPSVSAESVSNLPRVNRRRWLAAGATGLGLALCKGTAGALAGQDDQKKKDSQSAADQKDIAARRLAYLKPLVYVRKDIDDWLAGRAFPFCKYDPELGYLHIDRDFKEGLDGAVCRYRYDPSGARHVIACADQPCRINTYGNSFTSCEQVSDGETWQEVLAAHLGEPVRNFGIGGYSVYLAYLRMKREEKASPASYILFNIFDDDHYRNLLGWQRLRFGINRKSTCPPTPYVSVSLQGGTLIEHANPCPTPESLDKLCDLDSASRIFKDDYLLDRYVYRLYQREQGMAN